MVKQQWFVKMEEMAKPAIEALKNGSLTFVPESFGKTYLHWLEGIRDWCISRQLWWGHRLSLIHIYIRDNKNRTRPNLHVEEIYEYDLDSTLEELEEYCQKADFVFNLAGVNRPENPEDFMKGNFGFASDLLINLKKHNNKAAIMLSSSIQAILAGRFENSEYGRSKNAGEELFFNYAKETGAKVAVYRFPNLMGHSRPKYNSAVSTFCWAVANDEKFIVNDRNTELELLYIDDLVDGMLDLLEGKEQHCEFDGVETILDANGRFCCVPITHKVTLGEIVDLLMQFKDCLLYTSYTYYANLPVSQNFYSK